MDPQQEQRYKAWLRTHFKKALPSTVTLGFFSLIAIGLSLLAPWPLKFLADSVFGEVPPPSILSSFTQPQLLLVVMVALVGISIVETAFGWISGYIDTVLETNLSNHIQSAYFKHVLSLPLGSSNRLDSTDYLFRLNSEHGAVANLVLNSIVAFFASAVSIISVLAILVYIDWEMTVLSLMTIPLMTLSARYFGPKFEKQALKEEKLSTEIFNTEAESIQRAEVVQSFNRQTGQFNKFVNMLEKFKKLSLKGVTLGNVYGLVGALIVGIATIGVFIVGGNKVFAGELTFGVLIVFITYVSQLFEPISALTDNIAGRSESHAQAKRFFAVMDDYRNIEDTESGEPLSKVQGQLEFRNVFFAYKDKPVLKNVNLTIHPGEKVAFIGPSGAGKSTLLGLVPRFAIQDKGFVYIDGHETSQVKLSDLRDQVAIVSQNPQLFSITIGENIAFAEPDAKYPLPEVMAAATNAFASEFIDKLPEKYDTVIDADGTNLSGGQKQRIAIARAMFKRAPILLLDEPTSAQDTAAESKVLEGISRLMKGKTVLMVTHKHSLLSAMDTVYVIENGEIQNVNDYGGLDAYERYLEVHELKKDSKEDDQIMLEPAPIGKPTMPPAVPKIPISISMPKA